MRLIFSNVKRMNLKVRVYQPQVHLNHNGQWSGCSDVLFFFSQSSILNADGKDVVVYSAVVMRQVRGRRGD